MIYILNLNPSLDYHMHCSELILGITNRSDSAYMKIGGKGTNVGIILNNLDTPSTLFGFYGGFTGKYLIETISQYPFIKNRMIETNVMTRINVKLHEKYETEVNDSGDVLNRLYIEKLFKQIDTLQSDDLVVISGKLPTGIEEVWYDTLCQKLMRKNVAFVLDIASSKLLDLCKYKPLLIKPNIDELESIYNKPVSNQQVQDQMVKQLLAAGAQHCLLSLGSSGSALYFCDVLLTSHALSGSIVNTVGAGDSMVAGFIASYVKGNTIEECYLNACACAAASVFHDVLAKKQWIDHYRPLISLYKR